MCLAIPGRVVDIWDDHGSPMGRVEHGSVTKDVSLVCVPDLQVGDYTIVHMGFALKRLDEKTAHETLEIFQSMSQLSEATDLT